MKYFKNFFIYSGAAGIMVLILFALSGSGKFSDSQMIIVALLLVIVLPIIFSVIAAKRERNHQIEK